jgi:protein-S-isoprenylcysteine O-methyltransferase Ste14
MVWLWLRSIFYLAVVAGAWLILLPAALVCSDPTDPVIHLRTWPFVAIGAGVFALGTALALWSGARLIRDGVGTPFPLDPTRRLVTVGPYAAVRNPQGIALVLLTCAEALVVDSAALRLLPLFAVFFLIGLAEPFEDWEMRKRFGTSYDTYRARVPRWLPKRASRPDLTIAPERKRSCYQLLFAKCELELRQ